VVCPVHEATWPGIEVFCIVSPLLMCVVCYSFLNELSYHRLSSYAGQMASFIQVTACQPALTLAGWES